MDNNTAQTNDNDAFWADPFGKKAKAAEDSPNTPQSTETTPSAVQQAGGASQALAPGRKTTQEALAEWSDADIISTDGLVDAPVDDSLDTSSRYSQVEIDVGGWDDPISTSPQALAARKRQPAIPFDEEAVANIRALKAAGYTIKEITIFMRSQPGFECVTEATIATRIARGPTQTRAPRTIDMKQLRAARSSYDK